MVIFHFGVFYCNFFHLETKADEKKATESGYNSDKWDDSSSDIERMMCEDDNMSNPVVGILGAAGNESPENSQNMSMGSPICGRNSPDDG